MKISADIDISSLARQIKKVGKRFGDTQEQANKRWGVAAAKNLANYTQAYKGNAKKQKDAIRGDAYRVVTAFKGRNKKTAKGVSYTTHNGKKGYVSNDRFSSSPQEIVNWIDAHRNNRGRTKLLKPQERMVCSNATFNKAINIKHLQSGTAKDGYLDAGDHISRGQKGRVKASVGTHLKWTRKTKKLGISRRRRRGMTTISEIINNVSYIGKIISARNVKKAVHETGRNTLKWYKRTMAAEAKKKRTR